MKHLFTVTDIPDLDLEGIPENWPILLQGQPFSDRVQAFVLIGTLNNSEDLANKIGAYVHGRRWATLTRNDGHYLEVEVDEHDNNEGKASNAQNPRS